MANDLIPLDTLVSSPQLYIRQRKEWGEILIGWEGANQYEILNETQQQAGMAAELSDGALDFIKRLILRSHRPLRVEISDGKSVVLRLHRNFFFFLSDLHVEDAKGKSLGSVHRRWAWFHKKYDLLDEQGQVFATIKAPIWRIWRFPLIDRNQQPVGEISKKWSGFLREVFTDADTFLVNFGAGDWTLSEKAVILAAAISVDFDFFEQNQSNS